MEINFVKPYLIEIQKLSQILWQKGWAERNAGNFTIRIPHFPSEVLSLFSNKETKLENAFNSISGELFLVKGKNIRLRDLADNPVEGTGLLLVTESGKTCKLLSLSSMNDNFTATSEIESHLLIQQFLKEQKREDVAVLHTHPLELIILSHHQPLQEEARINHVLFAMHPEVKFLLPQGLGFVPFEIPGSNELANKSLMSLQSHNVILWEKHGTLAVGKTIDDAFDRIDLINQAAKIYLGCKQAGFKEDFR